MNRFFPLPLYSFIKIVLQNGGVSGKGIFNILPWLLKTVLFEPLRWVELAAKNKTIKEHTIIKPPIFILGYYRSGTTYLQQLFMEDDRLGYLSNFQMVFPEIMLSCEGWLTPVMEYVSKTLDLQNHIHRIPLSWYKSPGEEDVAMTTFMNEKAAQWGYFFPYRMNEYVEKYVLFENISLPEIEQWKKDYLLLLKKISIANSGKQLLLKSPPHTARIRHLLALFPGAKFIHIRRNPYDVYASNKRLWKVIEQTYALGSYQSIDVSSCIITSYSKMMQKFLHERHMIPAGNLIEIKYEDFIHAPVETMKQVYKYFQFKSFDYCEKQIREYSEKQKKYTLLTHQLTGEEVKKISVNCSSIIRQLGYKVL